MMKKINVLVLSVSINQLKLKLNNLLGFTNLLRTQSSQQLATSIKIATYMYTCSMSHEGNVVVCCCRYRKVYVPSP